MFCALEYRKLNPKASIAILERGLFSNGASTKNAGFACFGSLTELMDDSKNMDNQSLCKIVQMRIDGLALLRETLGDKNIDLQWKGGYELFFDKTPNALNQMDHFNELLKPIFKKNVFYWNNSKIKQFGFAADRVKHIIENPFEGQIDTGMMMRALRSIVNEKDISFFSNVTLTDFDFSKDQNHLTLRLKNIDLEKMNINSVFLDPPREGLDSFTTRNLKDIKNIIYISCGFESFKRDIKELQKTHDILNLAMFDQFPFTDHIESGAILKRIKPD